MAKNYTDTKDMEQAGIKEDDVLYKNRTMDDERDLSNKYGHRQDDLPSDVLSSQEDRQEPERQMAGYNIARSDEQDDDPNNELRKKNKDPNPEKQVDEFYQRYGQDDPLEKQI
ncbi:hypothetical protein [Neobacillus cucumis]|uniref:Uncharacterized protein n=1 Tax=Neobacillus cucumis TaxID=1740721 RepID=A0A2N5HR17_9BACI|nr:hypothetical protein [Neobacillus cucumis]PLS07975.1 hypothetical protein CVD27_04675 [Neobacillus cucumis]